jgi:hypothetical protein
MARTIYPKIRVGDKVRVAPLDKLRRHNNMGLLSNDRFKYANRVAIVTESKYYNRNMVTLDISGEGHYWSKLLLIPFNSVKPDKVNTKERYMVLNSDGNDMFNSMLYPSIKEAQSLLKIDSNNLVLCKVTPIAIMELDSEIKLKRK